MKLIVGLGNPDEQYKNTYHNLGFSAADALAEYFGVSFSKEVFKAKIAEFRENGEKIIIAKPQTYMNLSGESVREIVSFYKIALKDLLVIYDDFDLPVGELRLRESGSAGTHNGMRNIVKELSSEKFARARIGFKPTELSVPLIAFVLSGISAEAKPSIDEAILRAVKVADGFIRGESIESLKQKYNGKANKN